MLDTLIKKATTTVNGAEQDYVASVAVRKTLSKLLSQSLTQQPPNARTGGGAEKLAQWEAAITELLHRPSYLSGSLTQHWGGEGYEQRSECVPHMYAHSCTLHLTVLHFTFKNLNFLTSNLHFNYFFTPNCFVFSSLLLFMN